MHEAKHYEDKPPLDSIAKSTCNNMQLLMPLWVYALPKCSRRAMPLMPLRVSLELG